MTTPNIDSQNTRLKRAHIKLLRHKDTCLYGGVILMGESSVVEDESKCPTAYTDGYNKRYGSKFMSKLTDPEVAGLVLHENLHILMKHLIRGRDLSKENHRLANMAMDYAVNQVIVDLANKDPQLCKLPDGGLYDPMFRDWSFRKIYDYLKQEQEGGKGGRGGEPLDEHGDEVVEGMTQEQREQLSRDINEALQQSAILAGKLGATVPKTISDLMEPKVNWREALREFLASTMRGKDEYTWQRMNKRRLADEIYMPGVYSETVGELVIAIDTSGSISQVQLSEFASELASICETVTPEKVRVLWWDTMVHGEQEFDENNYNQIASLLKPQGGGGTRVGCVNEYIAANNVNAECVIVFTDGYVEDSFEWSVNAPTLWMVTRKQSFAPPSGVVINVEK
jgi:predicted metal-dependent peptidase